jgi:hypothetical protein
MKDPVLKFLVAIQFICAATNLLLGMHNLYDGRASLSILNALACFVCVMLLMLTIQAKETK